MTNEEIADKLVNAFIAYLAQTALNNDPGLIKESTVFTIGHVEDRAGLIALTEKKVREKIEQDLGQAFEGFRTQR